VDFWELLSIPTLRTVALGTTVLGVVSGALGSFAVLRRQGLLGDAVSHAALPGIAVAFLLTHSKSPLVLVAGAAAAGWLGTVIVRQVTRTTRVPFDSALGGVLAVFFGLGLLLLTFMQRHLPDAQMAGLDRFLFGQAATLLPEDVLAMAALGAVVLAALALFWKEFKLICFDPDYAASLGLPVRRLDAGLTALLVMAIVSGLQGVGVVLMSAMLIAPAAAARPWAHRLSRQVLLAGTAGGLAGFAGTLFGHVLNLPTGPLIVLCASTLVAVSLALHALAAVLQRRAAGAAGEP
jgi:manganese/zinc/iron transport system permease protein